MSSYRDTSILGPTRAGTGYLQTNHLVFRMSSFFAFFHIKMDIIYGIWTSGRTFLTLDSSPSWLQQLGPTNMPATGLRPAMPSLSCLADVSVTSMGLPLQHLCSRLTFFFLLIWGHLETLARLPNFLFYLLGSQMDVLTPVFYTASLPVC
jgi:hypothetical protein